MNESSFSKNRFEHEMEYAIGKREREIYSVLGPTRISRDKSIRTNSMKRAYRCPLLRNLRALL